MIEYPQSKESTTSNTKNMTLNVLEGKGSFIAGGTTSLVERLPSGDVIKTPLPGVREEDCRLEMTVEARIYELLGCHPYLVTLKSWDPQACTLTLEFMPNGTLKEYLKNHYEEITLSQKLCWISDAAAAIHLLHSAKIIHCDVGPHNFLLDANLDLKISDFSGSSIDGSRAMVCPGVRYAAPDPDWKPGKPPNVREDIFALGSTIYFIVTGKAPFEELRDDEVEEKFGAGEFPDLAGVPCANVITLCWQQKLSSAQMVCETIKSTASRLEKMYYAGVTGYIRRWTTSVVALCSSIWAA